MKQTMRSQSGMALGVVMAIMAVIAILATGMFIFSSSELKFSQMEISRAQAQYLARGGVEACAKAFPLSADSFKMDDVAKPVTAMLYLHKDSDDKPLINNKAEGSLGWVKVTITKEVRTVTLTSTSGSTASTQKQDYDAWVYAAQAHVGDGNANVKGYTLPKAYASDADSSNKAQPPGLHLGWVGKDGVLSRAKTYNSKNVYTDGGSAASFAPITGMVDWINKVLNKIFGTLFPTDLKEIKTAYQVYNGVLIVDEVSVPRLTLENEDHHAILMWGAPAIHIEPPLDFRGVNKIRGLSLSADTVVFKKEINLYVNNLQSRMGDLFLYPAGGTSRVYFNGDVYLHVDGKRYTVIPAGSSYTYDKVVDLVCWAMKMSEQKETIQSNLGFLGWLRKLVNSNDYTTGALTLDEKPVMTPTPNSLTQVIWE